eukprot:gnl/Dysnectes_brevis/1448_a1639_2728.p1 GENE.gnl/Dysnectes_brevis/1448_a1639_2728~~gnl/Dysnectes_brevis/1448_a1639_2728.p1  ORF type:complete len:284 (+),score=102.20 gnl/Dysnectes_brevis/1448_a1639_2728:48-899(+)
MSAIGTGYDLSASTYGPEGRVFQIDYALKATEKSGLVVGIRARDGVVLAVEKPVLSQMAIDSVPRIFTVDDHLGIAVCGMLPDGRSLIEQAREFCESYRNTYARPIPCAVLANLLSSHMQTYTHYSQVRPFGCSLLVAGDGELHHLEPSGDVRSCFGAAAGRRAHAANTELEKHMGEPEEEEEEEGAADGDFRHLQATFNTGGKLTEMSIQEALKTAAEVIWTCHDPLNDKPIMLEFSHTTVDGHNMVSADDARLVSDAAKEAAEEEEEVEEEDTGDADEAME